MPRPIWKPSSTGSKDGASRSSAVATRGSRPQSPEKCHTTGSAGIPPITKRSAFKLSDGVYKRKKVTAQEWGGAQKLGELIDVDISYAVPRRLHTLAFTGSKWIAFADPTQQTGWLIDIWISSPYVATGREHKVWKVTNAGTRLCSYVPETKNVVISEQYTLKTGNSQEGILKMVSEFSPAGIIGAGIPTSTILPEMILGDPPDGFVEVLPGFKLKWTSGAFIKARERLLVRFTLGGIQHEAEHRFLDISKDSCWSGRAQKAEVHARRPHLRRKLGGPWPFELVRQR